MSVEFINDRSYHTTVSDTSYYREIYAISSITQDTCTVGKIVLLRLNNGLFKLGVVVSLDPFIVTDFNPEKYEALPVSMINNPAPDPEENRIDQYD